MTLDDLSTPCVLVERRRLERNLQRMQEKADGQDVSLRPHVKTHKSSALARRQADRGASGLTTATVEEAENAVEAGFDDLRIAYTVVGEEKLRRVARLSDRARMSFCVDTHEGASAADEAFRREGRTANVLIEIDTGHHRCGVPWDGTEGLRLAKDVVSRDGLHLIGVLTHAGQGYHGPQEGETEHEALRRAAAEERDRILQFADALRKTDISLDWSRFEVSIGSTPTMRFFENSTRSAFAITEIRPGNYVFNDAMQVALGAAELEDCALTVLSTVVSKRRDPAGRDRLLIDAGKKVFTTDTGYGTDGYGVLLYNPRAMEPQPHAHLDQLSEEHGWVHVPGGATYEVGDRVRVVPNHACVTVHTRDHLFLVDGEDVLDTLRHDF